VARGIVPRERTALVRGSGVDPDEFVASPEPPGLPMLLISGRMLWEKGVGDFVEASRLLRSRGVAHRAVIVGIPDEENPNSIPAAVLKGWQDEGVIEWWGLRSDMPAVMAQCAIFVLPTYYPEGVPKVLIEAAASARPIIATDVPGCREIARGGINADLVPPRDPVRLAGAMERLLRDPERRRAYGAAGRRIAVDEFSERQVLDETLTLYTRLLPLAAGQP
jgi:glycosyltransferase involved in cell wall biosynthesis